MACVYNRYTQSYEDRMTVILGSPYLHIDGEFPYNHFPKINLSNHIFGNSPVFLDIPAPNKLAYFAIIGAGYEIKNISNVYPFSDVARVTGIQLQVQGEEVNNINAN